MKRRNFAKGLAVLPFLPECVKKSILSDLFPEPDPYNCHYVEVTSPCGTYGFVVPREYAEKLKKSMEWEDEIINGKKGAEIPKGVIKCNLGRYEY